MRQCPCGHEYDADNLGVYGCPNCNGDAMSEKEAKDDAAGRQARSRETRAKAGGKPVSVFLTPKAATKLEQWQARGERIASAINKLLERSRP